MAKRIWRHPAAEQDLLDIWVHVASDNPRAADKLAASIVQRLEDLRDFPEIGSARPDIRPGVRSLLIGNYVILYVIRQDRVDIVRIVHGRRDLTALI